MIGERSTTTPIYNENNFVYYSLPLGKEDTKYCAFPENLGQRPRVIQKKQQGLDGWYDAAKRLRVCIGSNYSPEFEEARAIEKRISDFSKKKKEIRARYNHDAITKKFFWLNLNDKNEAKFFLEKYLKEAPKELIEDEEMHKNCILLLEAYIKDEGSQTYAQTAESLLKKELYGAFYIYASQLNVNIPNAYREYRGTILEKLLLSFGTVFPPTLLAFFDKKNDNCLDNISHLTGTHGKYGPWKNLELSVKINTLFSILQDRSLKAYGFKESSWNPLNPFEGKTGLIAELRKNGPLLVQGGFGDPFYEKPCEEVSKRIPQAVIDGQHLYGWTISSKEVASVGYLAAVVVVGAKLVDGKKYVYFVNPKDDSDPAKPQEERIYVISNDRFVTNIAATNQVYGPTKKEMPAYGYVFKID